MPTGQRPVVVADQRPLRSWNVNSHVGLKMRPVDSTKSPAEASISTITNKAPSSEAGFPFGGGGMGALIRALDWSKTSLGPISKCWISEHTKAGLP
jgi:hypothetical protein